MKPIAGFLLLLTAGCSGFDEPTPFALSTLPLLREPLGSASYGRPPQESCRFQMSIDSPWLAGEFEGIAVADHQIFGGRLRAQFFGDLGPKVADLTVQWGRIVGFFPQTREGIDCWLPREASPHPLLFIGASLAEELLERDTPGRVLGIREEPEGAWLQLRSYIAGTEIHRFMSRKDPKVKKRRYWWMTGVHWEEEWISPSECLISAPSVTIRVRIRERGTKAPATPFPMDLILPEDVRIVAGSRK